MTLQDILDAANYESQERQRKLPLAKIRRKAEKMGEGRGFARALRARPFSVIAEIKRASPSMGHINESAIAKAHRTYHEHPVVSAISVLTQERFFSALPSDLGVVRALTQVRPKPILRKDFIFSEYEIYFSRYLGADAILLMANVVTDPIEFRRYHNLANELGMDVLCEVHEESEISILPETARVCGINARHFSGGKELGQSVVGRILGNGKSDTKTDLGVFALYNRLSHDAIKVAESGITAENIGGVLKANPFNAALIGTSLLKAPGGIRGQLDSIQRTAQELIEARSGQLVGELSQAR